MGNLNKRDEKDTLSFMRHTELFGEGRQLRAEGIVVKFLKTCPHRFHVPRVFVFRLSIFDVFAQSLVLDLP